MAARIFVKPLAFKIFLPNPLTFEFAAGEDLSVRVLHDDGVVG